MQAVAGLQQQGQASYFDVDLLGDINVVLPIQVYNLQCLQEISFGDQRPCLDHQVHNKYTRVQTGQYLVNGGLCVKAQVCVAFSRDTSRHNPKQLGTNAHSQMVSDTGPWPKQQGQL